MSQSITNTFNDHQSISDPLLTPRFASSIDAPFIRSTLSTGLLSPDPSDHGDNWSHTDITREDSHPSDLTFCSEKGDLWMRQGSLPPSESEAIRKYYDQLHHSAPFCLMTQPFFDDGSDRVVSKRKPEPELEPPQPKKQRIAENSTVSSSGSLCAEGSCESVMVQEEKSGDTEHVPSNWTAGEIARVVRKKSKVNDHRRKKNINAIKLPSPAVVAETKAAAKPCESDAPFISSSSTILSLKLDIDEGTTNERCTVAVTDKLQEKTQPYDESHHTETDDYKKKVDDIIPGSHDMTMLLEPGKQDVERPDAEASTDDQLPVPSDISQANDRYTENPGLPTLLASRHQQDTRLSSKSSNRNKTGKDNKLRGLPARNPRLQSSRKPPKMKVEDSLNKIMSAGRITRSKSSPADTFVMLDKAGKIAKALVN